MDFLTVIHTKEFSGVPLISWLTCIVALLGIIPLWIAGIKMNQAKEMRWQRIGATIMMGPMLWFLFEPLWLMYDSTWNETASVAILIVLVACAIERYVTLSAKLNTIDYIRQKHDEDSTSLIARV